MTRSLRAAIAAAIPLSLILAGVVSAHTATAACELLTLARAPQGVTADILTETRPPVLVLNDVPGNGTYPLPPGEYFVRWSDGVSVYHLEVTTCPTPSPSPTPNPTGTPTSSPRPTPSSTPSPTPGCEQGCSTPSPTRSTTPVPTLPPTSIEPTDPPAAADPGPVLAGLGFVLFVGIVLLLPNAPRRRRTR